MKVFALSKSKHLQVQKFTVQSYLSFVNLARKTVQISAPPAPNPEQLSSLVLVF